VSIVKLTVPSVLAPTRRRVDDVLGIEGGASAAGSSYWKRIRRCPREHALAQILVKDGAGSENLDLGLLFHHGMENYYDMIATSPTDVGLAEQACWESLQAFESEEGYEKTYPEVERLLAAYFDHYRGHDQWRIIAVEETLEYAGAFRYTARIDLIVEINGGMWVVEHKTARSISADLLSGYQMDIQILGQVWLLQQCVDLDKYPPLKGVLVNIVSKHKPPRFERIEVMPSRHHLAEFEKSMLAWSAIANTYERLDYPKALGNCTGPAQYFRVCDFYDICHGHPLETVDDTMACDAPYGFKHRGEE